MKISHMASVGLAVLVAVSFAAQGQGGRPAASSAHAPGAPITTPTGQQPQFPQRSTQMPMESQPQLNQQQQETARGQGERRTRPVEEKSSVTHHTARIGGGEINYTATVSTYIVKADDGTPKASFFFVAYTKDGVPDIARRPLSFVYNGGPGSASLFTHMGLGPRRVVLTPDDHGAPAP